MSIAVPIAIPWLAAVSLALLDGRRRWVGWAAVADAARELLTVGTHGYDAAVADGGRAARLALG